MRPEDRDEMAAPADAFGITPEELCVRLAKTAGIDRRVIVRSKSGGLRIVATGEKLRLAADEFILNVPIGMVRRAMRETKRKNGVIRRADLD